MPRGEEEANWCQECCDKDKLAEYMGIIERYAKKKYGISINDLGYEDDEFQEALNNELDPYELVLLHSDKHNLIPLKGYTEDFDLLDRN